jgi:DNA-binding YbaB/EbfC family protein
MKARLPQGYGKGPGNMQSMLKQAQKMQEDAAALQDELKEREYSAQAGGGMVSVTVTGEHQIKSLEIAKEVVDPEDVEMLSDLIIAAVNEAFRTAENTEAEEMEKISGGLQGLNIPGLL